MKRTRPGPFFGAGFVDLGVLVGLPGFVGIPGFSRGHVGLCVPGF